MPRNAITRATLEQTQEAQDVFKVIIDFPLIVFAPLDLTILSKLATLEIQRSRNTDKRVFCFFTVRLKESKEVRQLFL